MLYDIYFHNDFDGRASAAVMRYFLVRQGDTIGNYIPVNFDIGPRWAGLKFPNPAIIVDFIYHPKATWWFDHHRTSFTRADWQKAFRKSRFLVWDKDYPSCCHLVIDYLKKNFGFTIPKHLKELARWLDVVDAAQFKSARQTIEIKEPALQLAAFIDRFGKGKESLAWLIELLSEQSIEDVMKDARIKKMIGTIKADQKKSLAFYRKELAISGKVAFMDFTAARVPELRFAPFFLYPKLTYGMVLKKSVKSYHLTLGINPWRRFASRLDISALLKKYGGGGHRYVGGVQIETRAKAEKIINELLVFLNT
ncbi:MAG: hypothetical protein AAB652_02645 [Patescibacteria group bacterium]